VTRAADAVARALMMVGERWPYVLGGGNHVGPTRVRRKDGTLSALGFDCFGFAHSFCYQEPRHRPGFNRGSWATVSDDINCDAAIEDAEHKRELFEVVDVAGVGDLIVMPSIRDEDGKRIRIGHVWLVVGVPAEAPPPGTYRDYDTVQCQARTKPAIKRGPGPATDARTFRGLADDAWRIRILRVR
jgi:hypothetical protein